MLNIRIFGHGYMIMTIQNIKYVKYVICSAIEAKASKFKYCTSLKLDRKFNILKRKYGIPLLSNLNSDDIISNYSHRVLSEVEKKVLARGLRFCLPPKEVDTYDVKCSFETLLGANSDKRHGLEKAT